MSLTRSLLYANDTLIIDSSAGTAQAFMEEIQIQGKKYGLEFNNSKLEALQIGCEEDILDEFGKVVKKKDSLVYLGSLLCADGRIHSEVSRRIGAASSAFKELDRVWKHANICKTKKLEIYQACVLSNLMYGLQSAWLNESELKRIDGFHCRCLRKVLKIPPAYYSRISNAQVLQEAGKISARFMLLQQQMCLYGKVVRLQNSVLLRQFLIAPGGVRPIHFNFRKRGRPRNCWHDQVYRHIFEADPSAEKIWNVHSWHRCVKEYIAGLDRSI